MQSQAAPSIIAQAKPLKGQPAPPVYRPQAAGVAFQRQPSPSATLQAKPLEKRPAPPVYRPTVTTQLKTAGTPQAPKPAFPRTGSMLPTPAAAKQVKPAHVRVTPQAMVQRMTVSSPPAISAAGHQPMGRPTVVQPQLQISDVKQLFDKSADARKYLETEYQKILTKLGKMPPTMTLAEKKRLQEISQVADDDRYLYPIGLLQEAMDYIAIGKQLDIQKYDLRPDRTPERETDDSDPWGFVLHKKYTPPTKIEVPQSPSHETYFPSSSTYTPSYMDLYSGIEEIRDDINDWAKKSTKSHLGKNHYSYKLSITYRLDELETFTDLEGQDYYGPKHRGKLHTHTESSPYYTSKKNLAPQEKGEKPVSMESEMRDELTHLHKHYYRDEFRETSLFSRKKGVMTKTSKFYQTARIGQISSLYFHSEVQAASDQDGARELAQDAVKAMVSKGLSKARGGGRYALVVVAGVITGYSHSRTVCGNACKPALAHLSSIIGEEMVKELHRRRDLPTVKSSGLSIRRSREYRFSTHVGAHVEFQGLETGAQLGTGKPTVLPHNEVWEYQPF